MANDNIQAGIDRMIEVLQAARAGRRLQCRLRGSGTAWGVAMFGDSSCWDFNRFEYRIAPNPREWWIVQRSGHTDRAYAEYREACMNNDGGEIIHVVEV